MPMSKAGRKIKAKLKEQYGSEKGEGIFYAMENKGEIPGLKKMMGGGMVNKDKPTMMPMVNNQGYAKGGMANKGYAKGGMVKSTGKMNTGIKKCGE